MFTVSLTISVGCSKQTQAKNDKQICQADITKKIYASAQKQTRFESPDLLFVNSDSVKASVPPSMVAPQVLATIAGQSSEESNITADSNKSILEYITAQDDTLGSLAEKYGISVQTLLLANDLKKGAILKPGTTLVIPPVDGIIYNVVAGDTISKIAKTYRAKDDQIIAFNELQDENDLYVGDQIIIPGGVMPPVQTATAKPGASNPALTLPGDYFLCPINSPCTRTQGPHFQSAVDLSHGKCGEPIYAAASGTVMRAKIGGWNGGAGNYITILHPSGAITKYYHLQSLFVVSGQQVVKGQNIGIMGGQPGAPGAGHSTGCHLHFEVIGNKNPF